MKDIALGALGLALICVFIYGCYFVAKNVSYSLFYEDMVRQTVQEMVNEKSLK